MPYLYEDTVRGESRNVLTVPSSREDVLTETFASAFEENPIMAVSRWQSLREDQRTGPKLDAASARTRLKDAGMEKDLQVSDSGITEAALSTLMERKRIEKRRQETFARSEGGFAEGAERLGIAFATTLVDPISMGLNFVPVVGQARYARWLAGAGSLAARVGVRAGVGAAEGVVGAAIGELPVYAMRTQEQADYDAVDSLMNVTFGGVIGAGLHTTVGTLGELLAKRLPQREPAPRTERVEPKIEGAPARTSEPLPADVQRLLLDEVEAAKLVERMSPDAQQAALRAAVGQAVEGRAINVEPIIQSAPVRQTETPEFREWFGGSKITDEAGQPLRVYHGTPWPEFDSFDMSKAGKNTGNRPENVALHFTDSTRAANYYADVGGPNGAVMPMYLTMKNPLISDEPVIGRPDIDAAKAAGHDGIIARKSTKTGNEYIVFDPKQAKSAIGNSGRFDPQSASLTDPIDPEFTAAQKSADETFAREIEPTIEANLKAAEEEASLAEADAKALLKRLGLELDDPDTAAVAEGIERAERWARAAELATVCLVRGG